MANKDEGKFILCSKLIYSLVSVSVKTNMQQFFFQICKLFIVQYSLSWVLLNITFNCKVLGWFMYGFTFLIQIVVCLLNHSKCFYIIWGFFYFTFLLMIVSIETSLVIFFCFNQRNWLQIKSGSNGHLKVTDFYNCVDGCA